MNIQQIISDLTLEQKAAFLQGWGEWNTYGLPEKEIPSIFLSDGPHGLRKQAGAGDHLGLNASVPATCFPTAATMANAWDPALGEKLGRALGEEAAVNGVNVVLGPGLNMKRSPLCGRNFEYFSEDPYLAGKMAAAYIRGIQANGVAACPKHFAVNSQETRRMSIDAVVDERTLREIYLTGFEIAVQEGSPKTIMSSYNRINGCYANENAHLLTEILRQEWGFEGFVVTDWGADNDHVQGVRAGSNLVMPAPGPDCAIGLVQAVREGRIEESVLDERLAELLPVMLSTAQALKNAPKSFDEQAHHAIARECAEGTIVLLENDGILPLSGGKSLAIIGDFAESPRYQGAGSSVVNPTRLDNLKEILFTRGTNLVGYAQGYSRTNPAPDQKLLEPARMLAKMADTVILCIGLDEIAESEGMDRMSLELSRGQQVLIEEISKVNPNVILVISGGAPFRMPPKTQYRAAIHGYLGGQAGANAMVDALLGVLNPSGKLSETWPCAPEDVPTFPSGEKTMEYREGPYIGYRYYDTAGVPVRYPFGHGLSYTSFAYSHILAEKDKVSFTLTNTGNWDGAEIAQVYVSCKNGKVFRPKKELKGFAKVFLKAGQCKTVTVELDEKAFRYFNVKTNRWEVETADYEISVGASVADIRLTAQVHIAGTDAPQPYGPLDGYETGAVSRVDDRTFEALLGHPIPDSHWSGLLEKNDAICQLSYAKSWAARLVYRILTRMKKKAEKKGKPDLNILFIYNMPFRAMGKMTGGMVSEKMVDDIVLIVNGHFFRGVGRLIADFFRNQKANRAFEQMLKQNKK